MRSGSDARAATSPDPLDADPRRRLAALAFWDRLRPYLGDFGITRVADITGLDRIGIPVAQACRPGARSNVVTQGKGATPTEAALSATLESIEMAAGEDLADELTWDGEITPGDRTRWSVLADRPGWPGPDERWVRGWEIGSARPAPVPEAVLSTDFTTSARAQEAPILRSSIGNGAGASPCEAVWHGLLECIENDARIRFATSGQMTALRQIHLPSVTDATVAGQVGKLALAGLRIGAWEISQRPGPRAVMVRIMENPHGTADLPLPADGYGCRTTLASALSAAITEAAQARLAVIAGSREDMTRRLYAHDVPAGALAQEWAALAPGAGFVPAPDRTGPGTPKGLVQHLAEAGVGPVVFVPLLSRPNVPLHVTRVCAPGLLADPERAGTGT